PRGGDAAVPGHPGPGRGLGDGPLPPHVHARHGNPAAGPRSDREAGVRPEIVDPPTTLAGRAAVSERPRGPHSFRPLPSQLHSSPAARPPRRCPIFLARDEPERPVTDQSSAGSRAPDG